MLRFTVVGLALIVLVGCAHQEQPWLMPPALEPGDTIALVAPSRSVAGRDLTGLIASIESWGFNVRLGNVDTRRGNLGGTDEERAQAFMDAWLDPEVDMVWCITGGYGTTRFIDQLDYEALRADPKIMAGMSDITGLHTAINTRAHVVTFLGPTGFGPVARPNPSEYATEWFWRVLAEDSYFDAMGNRLEEGFTYTYPTEPRDPGQRVEDQGEPKTVVPGVGRGRLVGGNLSLVQATIGSPYQIETAGNILVLEDVRESPYRIDRMLCQMDLAGLLDDCAGVVLGTWSRCQPDDPDDTISLDQVFHDYFADRPYPVIANFPTGHVPEQAMMPMGAMAELDANAVTLRVLENPVTLSR